MSRKELYGIIFAVLGVTGTIIGYFANLNIAAVHENTGTVARLVPEVENIKENLKEEKELRKENEKNEREYRSVVTGTMTKIAGRMQNLEKNVIKIQSRQQVMCNTQKTYWTGKDIPCD